MGGRTTSSKRPRQHEARMSFEGSDPMPEPYGQAVLDQAPGHRLELVQQWLVDLLAD